MSELLDVDVTAAGSGEQQGRVDSRGIASSASRTIFRSGTARTEPSVLPPSFENTSGEAPANVEKVLLAVDVSAFQGEQFLRT